MAKGLSCSNIRITLHYVNGYNPRILTSTNRLFSTTSWRNQNAKTGGELSYKVVVVGGGTGGCSLTNKFARKFGKDVAVIEPADKHYYQPMFTLVGGGLKTLDQCTRSMSEVLPSNCDWLKQSVVEFQPENNLVLLDNGKKVRYDYLIVGMGLKINFEKIKGLPEAFSTPGVCSNYTVTTVGKTLESLRSLKSGKAVFSFPSTPIKCPGAPQKIMYLADAYWRQNGVRDKIEVNYNTALPVIFGVPKYAASLRKVCESRGLNVNYRLDLAEVRPSGGSGGEAIFNKLNESGKPSGDTVSYQYDMLHVAPPCAPPDVLASSDLAEAAPAPGFMAVNQSTLQHVKYPNVFGIGDCTNLPTSKTAAACSAQAYVIEQNLKKVMEGKDLLAQYDGYTSCPLTTGFNKCILAEFGYAAKVMETFPVDQGVERRSMYYMKKEFMPRLYWNALLKGTWNGPGVLRKLFHPRSSA